MSIGSLGGIAGSAAGSSLQQTHSSDVERAGQDLAGQQRRVQSDQKAEAAAGIGEADGDDHEPEDRDADGRRLWEEAPNSESEQPDAESTTSETAQSKDTTGQSGNLLDLSG